MIANKQRYRANMPLAAQMRPDTLEEFVGQEHLVGKDGPLKKLIKTNDLISMIFWGPPGSGKTTLARIIANETDSKFVGLSAVNSGKSDVRKVIEIAQDRSDTPRQHATCPPLVDRYSGSTQSSIFTEKRKTVNGNLQSGKTVLFIDEIHRFNKVQQDFLLPYVEDGTITLIGATTENPSFEVVSPLLSRCRVFVLKRHKEENIKKIILRALNDKKQGLGSLDIEIKGEALEYLAIAANGDPRTALNVLELAVKLAKKEPK